MRRIIAYHGSPGHPDDFLPLKKKIEQLPWITPISPQLKNHSKFIGYPSILFPEASDIIIGYSFGCNRAIKHFLDEKGDKLVLISPYIVLDPQKNPKGIKKSLLNSKLGTSLVSLFATKAVEDFIINSTAPLQPPENFIQYVHNFLSDPEILKNAVLEKGDPSLDVLKSLRKLKEHQNRIFVIGGQNDIVAPPDIHVEPIKKALLEARIHIIPNAGHSLQWTHTDELVKILNQEVTHD